MRKKTRLFALTVSPRFVFSHLSLTMRPSKKLGRRARKNLEEHFKRVAFWSFDKNVTLDHAIAPHHLAFTTTDKMLIGVYTNGTVDFDAYEVDTSKASRIENLASRILGLIRKATGQRITYRASLFLHSNVTQKKLLRFIQTSSKLALSPYLRQQLGRQAVVRGVLVQLDKNSALGVAVPDDLDFMTAYEIPVGRKGLLRLHMSELVSKLRGLAG